MKPDQKTRQRIAAILGETVEDLSADAVIVAVTRRVAGGTETFAVPFGNIHAVRGLAEFVYGSLFDDELDEAEETEEVEGDEDESDE
tara:strand:+ start:2542 stop:2802 length:261 start_codon:yes stop_codon:yes gene_type:complete